MALLHAVFVHGTSVRKEGFVKDFQRVDAALRVGAGAYAVEAHPCLWGEVFGAKLNAGGKSIPTYDLTRKPTVPPSEEAYWQTLWQVVLQDPYYELDLIALRPLPPAVPLPPGTLSVGAKLFNTLSSFDPAAVTYYPPGIEHADLEAARAKLAGDAKIEETISKAVPPMLDYRLTIARALVSLALQSAVRRERVDLSMEDRERFKDALVDDVLGGREGGLFEWVKNQAWRLVSPVLQDSLTDFGYLPHRGSLSDQASPFFADIIMYQGRGQEIRDYLAAAVQHAGGKGGPTVLIGHSLGGIVCVDALLMQPELRRQVPLLVTYGSQSPLFYEWNALAGLRWGQPLPMDFPRWINLWDPRDPLAYVGEGVFPNGGPTDVQVDNGQPVTGAHTAYSANPRVWEIVRAEIAGLTLPQPP